MISACGAVSWPVLADNKPQYLPTEPVIIKTVGGEEFFFNIEMARTPFEHEKGLMYREKLPEDGGMLFIFDSAAKRSFWMKDTLIPLDMLFLGRDGEILHIHRMARPQDPAHIAADRPSWAVLELRGGTSDTLGISAGDKVVHQVFRNNLVP